MSWEAMKLPNGCMQENTACDQRDLSLCKVTTLDLLWYEIRPLGIVEIKLTENSFANETDIRTNHLLSKMSPIVLFKKIHRPSLVFLVPFSYNEVSPFS